MTHTVVLVTVIHILMVSNKLGYIIKSLCAHISVSQCNHSKTVIKCPLCAHLNA